MFNIIASHVLVQTVLFVNTKQYQWLDRVANSNISPLINVSKFLVTEHLGLKHFTTYLENVSDSVASFII